MDLSTPAAAWPRRSQKSVKFHDGESAVPMPKERSGERDARAFAIKLYQIHG